MKKKIVTAAEAASAIHDGAFIAVGGVGINGVAREVIDAILDRYDRDGRPKNISLIHTGGINIADDFVKDGGLLGAYYSGFPNLNNDVIRGNTFPVYSLTQGIAQHAIRAQANNTPYLTKVGLHTFLDPRIDAGAGNGMAAEKSVVSLATIDGEEYLHFKIPPIDVAIIRGTTADTEGNITTEEEPVKFELLYMAMAARRNGGVVIAQVKNIAPTGSLAGANVKIPGFLVDYVVPCSDQGRWHTPNHHARAYGPGTTGYHKVDESQIPLDMYKPVEERMIVARRAISEIKPGYVCNVGIGMPDGVAYLASKEGVHDMFFLTNELGAIGGHIGGRLFFAASFNARAYIMHQEMFDLIDGGGLDLTCLGSAEIGEDGSVNVTRIAGRVRGSGGFINIASCAGKVVFLSSMTVGGSAVGENGKIRILEQGKSGKFPKTIDQISFSAPEAVRKGQEVFYVTERAVFKLIDGKVTLIELAEGLDMQKDVLDFMDFKPEISPDLKPMPAFCFEEGSIGLRQQWEALL